MFCHTCSIRSDIPRLSANQHSGLEPPSLLYINKARGVLVWIQPLAGVYWPYTKTREVPYCYYKLVTNVISKNSTTKCFVKPMVYGLKYLIINWVVRALNADWLTAVVCQTVYHGYDKCFFLLFTLVTSL